MSLRSDSHGNTPPTAADTPPGTYPITTDHMVSTDDQLMQHTTGDASLSYISMYDDHTIRRNQGPYCLFVHCVCIRRQGYRQVCQVTALLSGWEGLQRRGAYTTRTVFAYVLCLHIVKSFALPVFPVTVWFVHCSSLWLLLCSIFSFHCRICVMHLLITFGSCLLVGPWAWEPCSNLTVEQKNIELYCQLQ